MTSDKKSAALLAEIFVQRGLKHIVISPGSRNAPLILSFAGNPFVQALSIVDERSAAFFALGLAQQTRQTVAIACTSGTAALNYAPAIAEAYYQKIPLLILTADRPPELIDQGDGQTIRQKNIFRNYIKYSYELPEMILTESALADAQKMINKAINQTMYPAFGPVHINLPFSEPIYGQVESHGWEIKTIYPKIRPEILSAEKLKPYVKSWKKHRKKLLIAGVMEPNAAMTRLMQKMINDPSVVLLTETTSNLNHCGDCVCIDKVVSTFRNEELEYFKPDLLVSFGGHIVSKMVKEFIRKNKPAEHWHIDPVNEKMNTFQCLTSGIKAEPYIFFNQLYNDISPTTSDYKKIWQERIVLSEMKHQKFLEVCEYSDLKVFETIFKAIPGNHQLQLGNSTPVRYAQLFGNLHCHQHFSNRGTSGIDGSVSTAAGACHGSKKPTTLIVGDLGFFYDSNALMNNYLDPLLRIIVINNGGGGIFRFIAGPDQNGHLLDYFETKHNLTTEYIAKTFHVAYLAAHNLSELNDSLRRFYDPQQVSGPAILEVFTPNEKNGEILRSYFKYLKD